MSEIPSREEALAILQRRVMRETDPRFLFAQLTTLLERELAQGTLADAQGADVESYIQLYNASNFLMQIEADWVMKIINDAPEVETLANSVADNGDVYFVPAFSGLFAPYWRADARGVIAGLTRFSESGHLARAVLEAVAYQSRDVLEAMEADSGVVMNELKVDGGMVVNELRINPNQDCLAHVLNANGYRTGYIGKWHLWSNIAGHHGEVEAAYTPPGPYRLGFDGFWAAYNFHCDFIDAPYYHDEPKRLIMPRYETDSEIPYPALLVLGPFMGSSLQTDFVLNKRLIMREL